MFQFMLTLMYKNIEDLVGGGGRGRWQRRRQGRRRRGRRRRAASSVLAARVLVIGLLDVRKERRQRLHHHACTITSHSYYTYYRSGSFRTSVGRLTHENQTNRHRVTPNKNRLV